MMTRFARHRDIGHQLLKYWTETPDVDKTIRPVGVGLTGLISTLRSQSTRVSIRQTRSSQENLDADAAIELQAQR
jgi:hypothetical protein